MKIFKKSYALIVLFLCLLLTFLPFQASTAAEKDPVYDAIMKKGS